MSTSNNKKTQGKAKTKSDTIDGLSPTAQDEIKCLRIQNMILQQNLADRTKEYNVAVEHHANILKELKSLETKLSHQELLTQEVTNDMSRQFNGMQNELLAKILKMERSLQNLHDEAAVSRRQHEEEIKAMQERLETKDYELDVLQEKMEQSCNMCASMLSNLVNELAGRYKFEMVIGKDQPDWIPLEQRMLTLLKTTVTSVDL